MGRGFAYVEAKGALHLKELETALGQLKASVEAVQKYYIAGGYGYRGTEAVIITCDEIKYLGKYAVSATGVLMENGKAVLIDGIEVIVKLL